jgi:hypothetical protein
MAGGNFFITGARAPVALHLARLLKVAGYRVYLGDSLRAPLAAASHLHDGYHRLPEFRSQPARAAGELKHLLTSLKIDCVIPTCEEALYLGQIWQDHAMPAPLFAPDFALLARVHNKHSFITLCQSLGFPAPQTQLLQLPAEVLALAPRARDLVFKPVYSRFATHTVIRPYPKRLTKIRPSPSVPWVAQDFLAGDELCAYAVAINGKVMALAAYRGLIRAGLGASLCFEPVEDANLTRFVTDFIAATGWTGQISFDLIRKADGTVLPIECNPRATSGLHFFRDPMAFSRAILGEATAKPDVTRPQGLQLAIWLYGLPQITRPGGWQRLRHALAEVEDITDWPGDRLTLTDQLRPFAEIAARALRQRISLQAASTRDIEWDGPDQSSIS